MFHFFRLLSAAALIGLTALPAQAASLTVTNNTEFEIYYLGLFKERGSSRTGLRTFMPGETFTYHEATGITKVSFDIGTCELVFEGMKNHSSEDMNYVLTLDTEFSGLPSLAPADAVSADPVLFDQALYFIPDETTAQEVCPAVLKWWQSAHKNLPVSWTGTWGTLKEGSLSYCTFQLKDEAANEAAAPAAMMGDVTYFASEQPINFTDLYQLGAKNAAIAKGAVPKGDYCTAQVRFGDQDLIAELRFDDGPFADSPCPTMRMTTWKDDGAVGKLLNTIKSMNYRPFFLQMYSGSNMDTDAMLACWKTDEVSTREEAEALVADIASQMDEYEGSAALEAIFIPADLWDAAIAGKAEKVPAFNMRIGTSRNVQLYHMPEYAGVVQHLMQSL